MLPRVVGDLHGVQLQALVALANVVNPGDVGAHFIDDLHQLRNKMGLRPYTRMATLHGGQTSQEDSTLPRPPAHAHPPAHQCCPPAWNVLLVAPLPCLPAPRACVSHLPGQECHLPG